MRNMSGGRVRALILVPLMLGGTTAVASAATVTVTGDDGQPLALAQDAAPTIRTMAPTVVVASERWFAATVTTADGAEVTSTSCSTGQRSLFPEYRGNQAYAVTVTEWTDFRCTTPVATEQYGYAIAAGIELPRMRAPFALTRTPGQFGQRPLQMPVTPNPGASTDIVYARSARLGPDGGIRGATRSAFLDTSTGTARLTFPVPGVYTVVARARSGGATSPWSAPLRIRTVAPFDISRVSFLDSVGPSYQLRGHLRDAFAAGGTVRIAIARGTSGGTFRSIGTARIARNGTFTHRFTQTGSGVYRVRYTFAGSPLVLRGEATQRIRITARPVFRR